MNKLQLTRFKLQVVLTLWASLAATSLYAVDATWIGGDSLWTVAGNWSGGVVPDNDTFDVVIDSNGAADSSVVMNLPAISINSLVVDSGDGLAIAGNTLTTGSISGAGQIDISVLNAILTTGSGGNFSGQLTGDGQLVVNGPGGPCFSQVQQQTPTQGSPPSTMGRL